MRRMTVLMYGLRLAAALMVAVWATPALADRAQAKEWFDKGSRAQTTGDAERALEYYERAIAQDADYKVAYERAARLWISEGEFHTAIEHLERFTLRHPGSAFAWYALAYSYRRTGRFEHAAMAYGGYIDLRPDEAAPHFGLGMVRLRLHDASGAQTAFERYLVLERDSSRTAFVRQAERELASLADAKAKRLTDGKKAKVSERRSEAPATFSQQMVHLQRMMANRRYASAQTLAERVQPDSAQHALELALLRARIYVARGLTEEARQVLWSVLAAAPTMVDAYRMLMNLERSRAKRTNRRSPT